MKFLIAHISKPGSANNNSYKNYYFEKTKININENMLWDDNKKNTLTIGDFVIFYCWGKRVEIHKVINATSTRIWQSRDVLARFTSDDTPKVVMIECFGCRDPFRGVQGQ